MDVDVVVRVQTRDLPRLLATLEKAGLRVNKEKVLSALEAGFKILTFKDNKTPHSVDLILSERRLRRRPGSILGLPTYYQMPEELILTKLRMIKATIDPERAMKDKQDVRSIIQFTNVKLDSIKKKAEKQTTLNIFLDLLR